jgi:hypothetical protein
LIVSSVSPQNRDYGYATSQCRPRKDFSQKDIDIFTRQEVYQSVEYNSTPEIPPIHILNTRPLQTARTENDIRFTMLNRLYERRVISRIIFKISVLIHNIVTGGRLVSTTQGRSCTLVQGLEQYFVTMFQPLKDARVPSVE